MSNLSQFINNNAIDFIATIEDMNLNDFTNLLRKHESAIIMLCNKNLRVKQAVARKLRTLKQHAGLAPYYLAMVA